jgi:nuclear protein localization family protein 4
MVGYHINYLLF